MAIRTVGLHWYARGEKVDAAWVVLRYSWQLEERRRYRTTDFSWREVWAILKSSHTGKITHVDAWGIIRVKGNFISTWKRSHRCGGCRVIRHCVSIWNSSSVICNLVPITVSYLVYRVIHECNHFDRQCVSEQESISAFHFNFLSPVMDKRNFKIGYFTAASFKLKSISIHFGNFNFLRGEQLSDGTWRWSDGYSFRTVIDLLC